VIAAALLMQAAGALAMPADPRQFVACDDSLLAEVDMRARDGAGAIIWRRGRGGWHAIFHDSRFEMIPGPLAGRPKKAASVYRAACSGTPPSEQPQPVFRCAPQASRGGRADDGTLAWFWYIPCGGGRSDLLVYVWTGDDWTEVDDLQDRAARS
jgi:hypothetical protein